MANFPLSVRLLSGTMLATLDASPEWSTEDVIRQLPHPGRETTYLLVCKPQDEESVAKLSAVRDLQAAFLGSSTLASVGVQSDGEMFAVVAENAVASVLTRAIEAVQEYKVWGAFELFLHQKEAAPPSPSMLLIGVALCKIFKISCHIEDGAAETGSYGEVKVKTDRAVVGSDVPEVCFYAAADQFFNVQDPNNPGSAGDALVSAMEAFNVDADPQGVLSLLAPFVTNLNFTPQLIGQRAFCGSLAEHHLVQICIWIHVLYKYAEVSAGRAFYSEADVEGDLNIGVYEAHLSGEGELGLRCRGEYGGEHGAYISVEDVYGGLALAWNQMFPRQQIEPGHMILKVNGKQVKEFGLANNGELEHELALAGTLCIELQRKIRWIH